jgi:hypothetical protein
MTRSLTSRLSTAFALVVFATTGGLTGMQVHMGPGHVGDSGDVAVAEQHDHSQHSGMEQPVDDAGHSGHAHHGSGEECTCVGPCQSGASPGLPDVPSAAVILGETDDQPIVPSVAVAVWEDPASYLFPLPNAPPSRT